MGGGLARLWEHLLRQQKDRVVAESIMSSSVADAEQSDREKDRADRAAKERAVPVAGSEYTAAHGDQDAGHQAVDEIP